MLFILCALLLVCANATNAMNNKDNTKQLLCIDNKSTTCFEHEDQQIQLCSLCKKRDFKTLKNLIEEKELPVDAYILGKPLLSWIIFPEIMGELENTEASNFVIYLITKNADVNKPNIGGTFDQDTPLHQAIYHAVPENIFERLVKYGFATLDLTLKNKAGKTVEDLITNELKAENDDWKDCAINKFTRLHNKLTILHENPTLKKIQEKHLIHMQTNLKIHCTNTFDVFFSSK